MTDRGLPMIISNATPDAAKSATDSVTLDITRNGLAAIADEMAISHVRAAYSTVARDMLDFSTAICDREGRVIAQGLSLAVQLGAIPRLMQIVTERITRPERGDVYFVNHPWQGGVHLPDIFFVKPVFLEGESELSAWTVIVSHMVDLGGRFPGSMSPAAASLWEEGLVIPLIPLVKNDVLNQPLLDLIAANTRDPVGVTGDIRSAMGALETGAAQYADFARSIGPAELRRQCTELLAATERATRAAFLRDIPDGRASATDHLDSPEIDGVTPHITCTVEKKGDRIHFDFTGTSPQSPGGVNCNIADVLSVCAYAARSVLTEDIPVNDGFYRCLDYHVPEGTLINAAYPAGVSVRGGTVSRMNDVAMAAMANLIPGSLPAMVGGRMMIVLSGTRADATKSAWVFLDYVGPGWGGRPNGRGVAGLSHPLVNATNIPVETIEQKYPLRLTEYSLDDECHGAGLNHSAGSTVREYESVNDGTHVNIEMQRPVHAAQGVVGGSEGALAAASIRRAGQKEWEAINPIGQYTLNAGDRLRCRLASGGGYGSPSGGNTGVARDKAGAATQEPANTKPTKGTKVLQNA